MLELVAEVKPSNLVGGATADAFGAHVSLSFRDAHLGLPARSLLSAARRGP